MTGLRTLTGNPSRKKITKQCPAAMASAVRVASSTKSASLPLRRTNRGPDASQKASPNRSDEPTPTSASCRSSTVLMKCACPITTFTSSGLSTGTTSQESVGVVTRTCCHRHPIATSDGRNANSLLLPTPRSPPRIPGRRCPQSSGVLDWKDVLLSGGYVEDADRRRPA